MYSLSSLFPRVPPFSPDLLQRCLRLVPERCHEIPEGIIAERVRYLKELTKMRDDNKQQQEVGRMLWGRGSGGRW